MKACTLVLVILLAGCAHTTNAERFDSVDQQFAGLREQIRIQQQMIAELRMLLEHPDHHASASATH